MRAKLNEQSVQQAIVLYEGGWSFRQIGPMLGVHGSTVRNYLMGRVEFRPPYGSTQKGVSQIDGALAEKVAFLYHELEYSAAAVGRALNMHGTTVVRYLYHAGRPPRPRGQAISLSYRRGRREYPVPPQRRVDAA